MISTGEAIISHDRHPAVCADSVKVTCINSCLAPVGTMDGSSIITVEGLGDCTKGFHPVQGAPRPCAATGTRDSMLCGPMHMYLACLYKVPTVVSSIHAGF